MQADHHPQTAVWRIQGAGLGAPVCASRRWAAPVYEQIECGARKLRWQVVNAAGYHYLCAQLLPERYKLACARSQPFSCVRCSKRMSDLHGRQVSVYHGALSHCGNLYVVPCTTFAASETCTRMWLATLSSMPRLRADSAALRAVNLLPTRMKLRIFADMPWNIRLGACLAPLKRQSPKAVIAPRVGDDDALSYTQLYRQMLDLVRHHRPRLLRSTYCLHGTNPPLVTLEARRELPMQLEPQGQKLTHIPEYA